MVCIALGFAGIKSIAKAGQFGTFPLAKYAYEDLQCDGTETDLNACKNANKQTVTGCTDGNAGQAAGVECLDFSAG